MKRKALIRQLTQAGCGLLRSGANHDIYLNPATGQKQLVPRHIEIDNACVGLRKLLLAAFW